MKQYVVTVNQRTYYVEVETAGEAQKPGEQNGSAPAGAAGAKMPVSVATQMPLTPSKPVMAAWTHPEPSGGYRRYRPASVQNRRNSL